MATNVSTRTSQKVHAKSTRQQSTKGALIKGKTSRLPAAILESPELLDSLKTSLKGYAGIYGLYKGKNLYYVGLASNLFGRLKTHQRDRHRGKWDHFAVFRIQRTKYLKDIETLIHHLVDPPGNSVKGRLPRDADIDRILRRELGNHRKYVQSLSRALDGGKATRKRKAAG